LVGVATDEASFTLRVVVPPAPSTDTSPLMRFNPSALLPTRTRLSLPPPVSIANQPDVPFTLKKSFPPPLRMVVPNDSGAKLSGVSLMLNVSFPAPVHRFSRRTASRATRTVPGVSPVMLMCPSATACMVTVLALASLLLSAFTVVNPPALRIRTLPPTACTRPLDPRLTVSFPAWPSTASTPPDVPRTFVVSTPLPVYRRVMIAGVLVTVVLFPPLPPCSSMTVRPPKLIVVQVEVKRSTSSWLADRAYRRGAVQASSLMNSVVLPLPLTVTASAMLPRVPVPRTPTSTVPAPVTVTGVPARTAYTRARSAASAITSMPLRFQ
jgi:hypothetical protein